MSKYHLINHHIKRKYAKHLQYAGGRKKSSVYIDSIIEAIMLFEEANKYTGFKGFNVKEALMFRHYITNKTVYNTDKRLFSAAYISEALQEVKFFFRWLSEQRGYRSFVTYSDADYFTLTPEDQHSIAKAQRVKPLATVDQIRHLLPLMPNNKVVDKRDRALLAFMLLTGAGNNTLCSLKVKDIHFTGAGDSTLSSMKVDSIDLNVNRVYQDTCRVNTTFSKGSTVYSVPSGDDAYRIVSEWVATLQSNMMSYANDNSPLFPKTKTGKGNSHDFEAVDVVYEHWSNPEIIEIIFTRAIKVYR